mmetsp:Transcript_92603/g.266311  ORF Transcript_92603/g.266311 Transcript_92603/m.266311 type:complete len:227 (+) Transcript_92603:329-1009(+)
MRLAQPREKRIPGVHVPFGQDDGFLVQCQAIRRLSDELPLHRQVVVSHGERGGFLAQHRLGPGRCVGPPHILLQRGQLEDVLLAQTHGLGGVVFGFAVSTKLRQQGAEAQVGGRNIRCWQTVAHVLRLAQVSQGRLPVAQPLVQGREVAQGQVEAWHQPAEGGPRSSCVHRMQELKRPLEATLDVTEVGRSWPIAQDGACRMVGRAGEVLCRHEQGLVVGPWQPQP